MLLKPVLVSCYLLKDSKGNAIIELTENDEDKSEKKALESDDEINHSTKVEWNAGIKSIVFVKSFCVILNIDDQIREIVSPPPQR